MPLIPAFRRQRQVNLWVWDQPAWSTKWASFRTDSKATQRNLFEKQTKTHPRQMKKCMYNMYSYMRYIYWSHPACCWHCYKQASPGQPGGWMHAVSIWCTPRATASWTGCGKMIRERRKPKKKGSVAMPAYFPERLTNGKEPKLMNSLWIQCIRHNNKRKITLDWKKNQLCLWK